MWNCLSATVPVYREISSKLRRWKQQQQQKVHIVHVDRQNNVRTCSYLTEHNLEYFHSSVFTIFSRIFLFVGGGVSNFNGILFWKREDFRVFFLWGLSTSSVLIILHVLVSQMTIRGVSSKYIFV